MNITEVRVKMVNDATERLRAFCSITLDGAFVIRDLKIIDGVHGPFVAMPSRKLSDRCNKCGSKNHLRARFCNECGTRLIENRASRDEDGRVKLHADIAHPINAECRERIQDAVIEAFESELELQKDPAYAPAPYDDPETFTSDSDASDFDELIAELRSDRRQRHEREAAGAVEHPRVAANGSLQRHQPPARQSWHDRRSAPAGSNDQRPARRNGRSEEAPASRPVRQQPVAVQRGRSAHAAPADQPRDRAGVQSTRPAAPRTAENPPQPASPPYAADNDADGFAAGIF